MTDRLPSIFYELKDKSSIFGPDEDSYGMHPHNSFIFKFEELGGDYLCYLYINRVKNQYTISWKKRNHTLGRILRTSLEEILEEINNDEAKTFLLFNLNLLTNQKNVSYLDEVQDV